MDRRITGIQVTDISRRAPVSGNRGQVPRNGSAAQRGQQRPQYGQGIPRKRRAWYIRRRNQLLRRMGLMVVGLILVVTVAVKGISALRNHGLEQENGRWENEDMLSQNSSMGAQMSMVGKAENTDPVIVLDAGHGGKDPGTMAEGINEKDINLDIAKKVASALENQGYQVIQTREDDTYLTLSERVKVATDAKAAAFVSIHQNALEHDTVTHGIQIYCNRDANPKSGKLTDEIHSRLLAATGAYDRGNVQDSDFHVVEDNPVPACLIETGFLTATEERANLISETYQEKIAQAIAEGIIAYLGSTQ